MRRKRKPFNNDTIQVLRPAVRKEAKTHILLEKVTISRIVPALILEEIEIGRQVTFWPLRSLAEDSLLSIQPDLIAGTLELGL